MVAAPAALPLRSEPAAEAVRMAEVVPGVPSPPSGQRLAPVEAEAPSDLQKERCWPSLPEAARVRPAGPEAVPRLRGKVLQALALPRVALRPERVQAPERPVFVD